MKLPTWDNAKDAVFNGNATPLDKFIYEYEPQDLRDAALWRKELADLVSYTKNAGAMFERYGTEDAPSVGAEQLEIKFTD